jgi:hypothetical protein
MATLVAIALSKKNNIDLKRYDCFIVGNAEKS